MEGKYGIITAEKKLFHPGEPLFLLRSTDPMASATILDYARRCLRAGCSDEHVKECLAASDRVEDWQRKNPTLVKRLPG